MRKTFAILLLLMLAIFCCPMGALCDPTSIAQKEAVLFDGRQYQNWTNVTLVTTKGERVGSYSLEILKEELRESTRNLTIGLTVNNSTDCIMSFDGYVNVNGWPIKTVSWEGGYGIGPDGSKSLKGDVTIKKDLSGLRMTFEPQGYFYDCNSQKKSGSDTGGGSVDENDYPSDAKEKFNEEMNDIARQHQEAIQQHQEAIQQQVRQQQQERERRETELQAQQEAEKRRQRDIRQQEEESRRRELQRQGTQSSRSSITFNCGIWTGNIDQTDNCDTVDATIESMDENYRKYLNNLRDHESDTYGQSLREDKGKNWFKLKNCLKKLKQWRKANCKELLQHDSTKPGPALTFKGPGGYSGTTDCNYVDSEIKNYENIINGLDDEFRRSEAEIYNKYVNLVKKLKRWKNANCRGYLQPADSQQIDNKRCAAVKADMKEIKRVINQMERDNSVNATPQHREAYDEYKRTLKKYQSWLRQNCN